MKNKKPLRTQRGEIIIAGVTCNKCGEELPPHTEDEHLDIDDPIHRCPHPYVIKDNLATIKLPEGTLVAYIEMNGRTYYIDDSTGEAVMDSWTPGEEATAAYT